MILKIDFFIISNKMKNIQVQILTKLLDDCVKKRVQMDKSKKVVVPRIKVDVHLKSLVRSFRKRMAGALKNNCNKSYYYWMKNPTKKSISKKNKTKLFYVNKFGINEEFYDKH